MGLLGVAFIPLRIFNHGLDAPVAVGPFLNGAFPSVTPGQGSGGWIIQDAFPNLDFVAPLFMAQEPGTNRLFVAEMNGRIQAFANNNASTAKTQVLDISNRVHYSGESGLLSFAFHPRYAIDSSYLYCFYQYRIAGVNRSYWRVSRFTMTPGGTAVPNSELVLIHQYDRADNHNGGAIFFGQDGYLYISVGDEGAANNVYGNCQRIEHRLFGGVLRIDVDRNPATSHPIRRQPVQLDGTDASFTANYYIPNSNPWQDVNGGILEEFYAIGLRNPHRMTYDPATNSIWVGDVGQGAREEVDVIIAGGNYEWGYREGELNGPQGIPNPLIGAPVPPVHTYPRNQGNCIIGGHVYRGPAHADLQGRYLFADNGSKNLWAMSYVAGAVTVEQLLTLPFGSSYSSISSFAVDASGEVYILRMNGAGNTGGKIYKLARQNPGAPEPPALLSQTGAFNDVATLDPAEFMIPYELNVPFWSDAAIKARWLVIPNDGTHDTPGEKIGFSANGEWTFPQGAVLVKHFELEIDESHPAVTRRLETRFLIHGTDGNYYGVTYRWRDDQTDAELLSVSRNDTLSIATPNGPREIVWYYPSRSECLTCHNDAAGGTLGPRTRQLNGDGYYPSSGRTANQLTTLAHLGMFDVAPDTNNLAALPALPQLSDLSVPLDDKVMAYIDANCASCHRPGTGVQANFDARWQTSLTSSGLLYAPALKSLGIHDARLIVPGHPDLSTLYLRLSAVHNDVAMPALAKNLVDSTGLALVSYWISNLSPNVADSCPTIDFGDYQVVSYGGVQDFGTHQVQENGATLFLQNNAWKKIAFNYTVTPNTILEFDFRSTIEGEEHAIGFDTDNTADGNRFYLHGTQQGTGSIMAFNNYNGSGNYQHFVIQVGNYYTGQFSELFFTADHDAAPGNGNSYFRHVRIYEGTCNTLTRQVIDFDPLPNRTTTDAPFALQATASSGLPVAFSVTSGPATVTGTTLTLTGQSGWVTVRATQPGNGTAYGEAVEVERRFFVAPPGRAQGTGLFATYYDNMDMTQQVFTRVDPVIDFYWGSGSPSPSVAYGTYSVVWEGEIEAPVSETFTFTTTTDDGVRLWVNNQLIVDAWQNQSVTPHSGTIALTAWQRVPIRMEFFEYAAYASAQLTWQSASTPQAVVPQAFLYPTGTTSLPVELLTFEATGEESQVLLTWTTASERQSSHFSVERSADGRIFGAIAQVAAAGNSNRPRDYRSTDSDPLPGLNYYRLKQVDIDGTFTYSEVRTVYFRPEEGALRLSAYPNPVHTTGTLVAEIALARSEPLILALYDQAGRMVYTTRLEPSGNHVRAEIPVTSLAPGIYLLSAQNQQHLRVSRVVVNP
ncbi:MAG: hypothetical protein OHK0039_14920 [Bacteroidia bacterium]